MVHYLKAPYLDSGRNREPFPPPHQLFQCSLFRWHCDYGLRSCSRRQSFLYTSRPTPPHLLQIKGRSSLIPTCPPIIGKTTLKKHERRRLQSQQSPFIVRELLSKEPSEVRALQFCPAPRMARRVAPFLKLTF